MRLLCLAFASYLGLVLKCPRAQASTLMWWNSTEIIPLGNGRLGAQVLGQVPVETINLNEDHIWSGSMNDPNNRDCSVVLPAIRQHIWFEVVQSSSHLDTHNVIAFTRDNDLLGAQNLGDTSCMSTPLKQQVYQTAGNLTISTDHRGTISGYNHTLDLARAIATTTYVYSGIKYTRSAIASHPDNVIAIRASTNVSGSITFNASFSTPMANAVYSATDNSLTMTGTGTVVFTLPPSIHYVATARFTASGPNATVRINPSNSSEVTVSHADEALIIIAIDTNYIRYDNVSGDPHKNVADTLAAVSNKTFGELLSAHIADHSTLFGRVNITLGKPSSNTYLSTKARKALTNGPDADQDLFALYTQFGRYLGIASSRKTEPSNLQGIWNTDLNPAWGSKYTLNINQQMNSWLAEPLNIAETLDPLWNLISELAERGANDARETYNVSRGWVSHHNTGIWRDSAPVDAAFYGLWPAAPAWLMQHLYEHYAFDPDPSSEFLSSVAYPLMKSLCEFYLDFLVPEPVDGYNYLTMAPSMSPEHSLGSFNGTSVSITFGSTIDNSLIRDLFEHTQEFASILGVDSDFAANLTTVLDRLLPFRIGSLGQLQEWAIDYNSNGAFTHLSHLYPLFPGARIGPRLNATLAKAANMSLTLRGDSSHGWPTAWRINCFARLLNGEKAYYYLTRLLRSFSYNNLWSINSVFQIDANFGGANGVAEMILQSYNGEIHVLPAIPVSWAEGSVTGFRARGGFLLDIAWSGGVLEAATITSTRGTSARVRYGIAVIDLSFGEGESHTLNVSDFLE